MITILQLTGLSDRDEVLFIKTDGHGQKRFLLVDRVSPLLEPLDPQQFQYKRLLYGGISSDSRIEIQPHAIFNSIGDPDRCSHTLKRVQQIAKKNDFPYINHPDYIPNIRLEYLYKVSREIEGLIVPRSLRIAPTSLSNLQAKLHEQGLEAPYIIKEVGTDPDRKNSFLVQQTSDIHELERFAFDGRTYEVTQYHEYRSTDGFYRKQRFFVIGDTLYPGHLIISEHWHVTNDQDAHQTWSRQQKKLFKEEKHFLKQYQSRQFSALLSLKEHTGLDFFAVDCHILEDESILLFGIDCEAHYFENVKENGYYNDKQIQRYNHAVEMMIIKKIELRKESKDA